MLWYYGRPFQRKYSYDFCAQALSPEPYKWSFRRLFIKHIMSEPMSLLKSMGFMFSFTHHDLLYLYNADMFDEMGLQDNSQVFGEVGVSLQIFFQSSNIIFAGGKRGLDKLPMKRLQLMTNDLSTILSKVGGFWSALKSISFFVMSYFLYRRFLKSEATLIA